MKKTTKVMRHFFIYNFSNTDGGQEKYIDYLEEEFKKNKIKLYVIKEVPSINNFLSPKNYPYKFSKNDEIIEILNGNSALYLRGALPRNKNVKKIYIQHSLFNDKQAPKIKRLIRIIIFFLLLRNISLIIRVSNKTLPNFFNPDKTKTIYNGVPLEYIRYKNNNPKYSEKTKLLMVGSINRNKNQALAIDIIRKSVDLKLTLVGEGELKNKLINKNQDLIKSGRLIFTGFQKEPRKYFLSSHILLVLSENEGLPFVILEAMSYGIPVIANNVGGINELISNNKNGILIYNNNFKIILKSINQLKKNQKKYNFISQNAKQTIKNNFNSVNMFNKFIKYINDLN